MSTIFTHWGLQVPQDILDSKGQPAALWGARAIFQPHLKDPIDLLHDRQSYQPEGVESPSLLDWLNREGIPLIRDQSRKLLPSSSDVIRHETGNYGIIASPNASYGYLYISAWRYDSQKAQYELQEVPAGVRFLKAEDALTEAGQEPVVKYSGSRIPLKGEKVRLNVRGFTTGTVTDYFIEYCWLGVRVKLDTRADWHIKQNGPWPYGYFFGIDINLKE